STVQLFDGNVGLTPTAVADGSGNWSITLTAALGEGLHNLTAKATDAAANTGSASAVLPLTIDTSVQPPSGLALAPGSDDGVSSSDNITSVKTPTLVGTAEANSTVKVFDGGTLLGNATANGSGAWSFTTPPRTDGVHSFTAVAVDVAGNTSAASSALSVAHPAPTPVVPPPTQPPLVTPPLSVPLARVKAPETRKPL